MEWIGIQCIGVHCITMNTIAMTRRRSRANDKGVPWLSLQCCQRARSPEVSTMPQCVACGAELEPPVRVPPPSTSKASTGSAARITAVITSSRPWWLPASSPRSRLAPDRQWPCHGKCPPASTTGLAITDQGYALERFLVPGRADSPAPNAKGKTPCDIGGNSVERTLPLLCSQHRSVLHIRRTTSCMCWSLSA